MGWTSVLGWQTGLASAGISGWDYDSRYRGLRFSSRVFFWLTSAGLLVLNDSEYVFKRWHGTLLVIAVTAFCIIFNTFLAKRLPMIEGMVREQESKHISLTYSCHAA